ncbi:glucosaminidase domain-containing protein, partial [Cohnella sp. REN36]|nr:glucosaminidase domain-containing protein [Cohnella sp. REN36]
ITPTHTSLAPPVPQLKGKQPILGASIATEEQMLAYARSVNPFFPAELPALYIKIGNTYGIRGDIAFCQMLKETGYHRFGGIVKAN